MPTNPQEKKPRMSECCNRPYRIGAIELPSGKVEVFDTPVCSRCLKPDSPKELGIDYACHSPEKGDPYSICFCGHSDSVHKHTTEQCTIEKCTCKEFECDMEVASEKSEKGERCEPVKGESWCNDCHDGKPCRGKMEKCVCSCVPKNFHPPKKEWEEEFKEKFLGHKIFPTIENVVKFITRVEEEAYKRGREDLKKKLLKIRADLIGMHLKMSSSSVADIVQAIEDALPENFQKDNLQI